MTWQQIFIPCPHCGQLTPTCREYTHIHLVCDACGNYYRLSCDVDAAGLPVPERIDPPRQFSRDEWREVWEASRAR